MKISVVGATGLVGRKIIQVMEEQGLRPDELLLCASHKSVGKTLNAFGKAHKLISVEQAITQKPNIALFSAGSESSLKYAPQFAEAGCTVIDNSSAWRMHPEHKLIVPEINAGILSKRDKIIANPNCSTIQLVMVLAPLHAKYEIKRVVVSTYQSVTGTGIKAVQQLKDEQQGVSGDKVYPHPIHENCLPHCDVFAENGYTKEEMKLVNETQKILSDDSIKLTATAVRVPVSGGHSESVNIRFEKPYELSDIRNILSNTKGVKVIDKPAENQYPTPKFSENKDDVFVGRIRKDFSEENSLNLWITADNLRKGAASNAVQIAQYLINKKLL
jgi:aspartate-semialdehyde dehydrogenase